MNENSILPVNRNLLGLAHPVVLVGLMGAGKTTVGRRLARDIGLEFIDSDTEIAEAAGCSIPDIFEIYGEPIFRDLEKRVILRLLTSEPAVIATGGGAFMNTDIRETIRTHAISVWLRAELDILLERVSRRNTRPLLEQGDKRAILSRLMQERHPVYGNADMVVDSGEGGHEVVVADIIRRLKAYKKEAIA
jgi:shikimate kinase